MGYRLLLVDDDDAARTSLQQLVASAMPNAAVEAASNAADGSALIEKGEPFHVVVTDMRMPEGTEGLTVVEAARGKDPTTEIIVLTAYGEMQNVYEALRRGANQYIDKNLPQTVSTQITAIEQAAGRAERQRRTARRLHAMERLAQELERRAPALMDLTQTLQVMVDYAHAISHEEA